MSYAIETMVDSDIIDLEDHKDVCRVYENVKFIKSGGNKDDYNVCFHYALPDYCLDSCEEAYYVLKSFYKTVPIEEAKKGDIISYHFISDWLPEHCDENTTHFAIIKKTDQTLNGTTIISKWGELDIYLSSLYDVLDMYGNNIVIWRKK